MPDVITLQKIFAGYAFAHAREADIHNAISHILQEHNFEFAEQYHLSASDIPDFIMNGIAIEVKVNGSAPEVTRQLDRYLSYDVIKEIVLITTLSKHRKIAGELRGKRITVIWIGGNKL